ncbi:DUF1641 domain-containing protein [Haladaptatus sp. AB618]|uniref:DUF1641 domain-containing protein n=1 Tax=Haladaptatus sp. AB618 TaxID=2934173 RepID=UPI00209BD545|nr:DUF1641 domain-containing protein [Haladaptatus sp. AB618]MCO8254928.1 DUF1641 domain-containing protein [Haladaptatus sp. AB618]
MSDTQTQEAVIERDSEDLDALVDKIDDNAEDLIALLDALDATQGLAEELVPELTDVARDNREPLRELRMAFEREETLVLLQKVGNNSERLVELLDVLEVSVGLTEDLAPELVTVVRENRETVERLRTAFEKEETIVLLERFGENADALVELLELLDVTRGLANDLVPELTNVARNNREPIADLRMAVEGFTDARRERETPDMYELGRNMEGLVALTETAAQPEVVNSLDAGLSAFTDETKPKKLGPFGLLAALRDDDVQQSLGVLVEAARRMARANDER